MAPLLTLAAILVRGSLGAPVLFRQRRPGLAERPFTLLKFRTMSAVGGEQERPLPDAARLTRLGRFLRRTSLDELPELWNVLRGEMSLVGPRPLLVRYLDRYSEEQARRHEVRPGVTGWAQVHGRNAVDWDTKLGMDVWYVDRVGLGLDLRILMASARLVLSGAGVSAGGHATAPEYFGPEGPNGGEPPS